MEHIFSPAFFSRPAVTVATELLGTQITTITPQGERVGGIIIETEAYGGTEPDEACHAYRGQTERNAVMFKAGGHIYVYRIYGCYWCVNIVTGPEGRGEAVLIRALMPTHGLEEMRTRRAKNGKVPPDHRLCAGPGMLCDALGIDRTFNGLVVGQTKQLLVEPSNQEVPRQFTATSRIGISRGLELQWRFVLSEYEKRYCAGKVATPKLKTS